MRMWPQSSQRSTCPPSAAVRQRSIAAHDLQLAEAEMAGMGRTPGGAMATEDIGDLQRRTAHRRRVTRPAAPRPPAQARSGRAGS